MSHDSQCTVYDFTYYGVDGVLPSTTDFVAMIRPLFKKWSFQKEACPTTGTLHLQGRGSLFKKKRHGELCKLLNSSDLSGMHVSESSKNSLTGDPFYTLKLDTRVEGPWTDREWKAPAYIPRQFSGLIDRLYPWQNAVMKSRTEFNDRTVNLIFDPDGNNGKSICAALAELHHGGIDLPPIGDHKELLQVVCDILMGKQERKPGIVFVDLPRAVSSESKRMAPFLVAIEQIKKGHVCDVRHHYRDWWFDSPAVWVFTNNPVDVRFLSKDRWVLWTITKFRTLMPMTRDEMIQLIHPPEN